MARKQDPARPYWPVRHEHDAALKAYTDAATMLHNAVTTAISLAKTPEMAMSLIQTLKTHADAFQKAALGDE